MPTSPSPSSPSLGRSSEELVARVQSWTSDLPRYCLEALTIRDKLGRLVPMQLNRAQLHLHRLLEDQRNRTGMVRALILKGRQQGVTTYTQARFYWRTSLGRGLRAFILTHEQKATDNVFEMADRFWRCAPIRPQLGAANAKELVFDLLDSGYRVATAGTKETGRSSTAQLFHGSEVAFWPHGDTHMAGIGQVVARMPGTEIILESTANGLGNLFHRLWQAAERGASDYQAIFIPWFWQDEYAAAVPEGFTLAEEEEAYRDAYGLTPEQMAWRRQKIETDFAGDVARFNQEYPATPSLAFTAVNHDPLIKPADVLAAVARKVEAQTTGLVVGVDPARFGPNVTTIARRRGRQLLPMERLPKQDTMAVAGRIAVLIREEHPMRVFIDIGGLGAGVVDRLLELGYGDVVTAINFGETANRPDRYFNRRAEMWGDMKDWLKGGAIPNDSVLIGDLSGPKYGYDSDGRMKLEKKEDMVKRGIASPDSGDAAGLTFAMPVAHLSAAVPGGNAWEDMMDAWRETVDRDDFGVHTG